MIISRHPDVERDIRELNKKYSTPLESLEAWERIFSVKGFEFTPGIDRFPGFGGCNIYKARVAPLKENCGKSSGYRIIFRKCDDGNCIVLFLYRHSTVVNEQEVIDTIRYRLSH